MFYTLYLYLSFVGTVYAKETPIEGSVEEPKKKQWEYIRCANKGFECPRMIKKQHDGYAEVCFLGNRDWYKIKWEGTPVNHKKQEKDKPNPPISHKSQIDTAKDYAVIFMKAMVKSGQRAQTSIGTMFYVNDDTYQMEIFILKPKLGEGNSKMPCKEILSFLRKITTRVYFQSVESCEATFTNTYKVPKCYYVLDSSLTGEKEKEQRETLSLGNEQEMFVILFDKRFDKGMKWYKTYEDLCKDDYKFCDDEE